MCNQEKKTDWYTRHGFSKKTEKDMKTTTKRVLGLHGGKHTKKKRRERESVCVEKKKKESAEGKKSTKIEKAIGEDKEVG